MIAICKVYQFSFSYFLFCLTPCTQSLMNFTNGGGHGELVNFIGSR